MRVLNYEAHHVLGLKDIRFDLDGHHLYLVGGANAQGKTSALTALLMALCGKKGMDSYPPISLRDGESKGWVKVELTGDDDLHENEKITVELYLRRKKTGVVAEEFRVLDSTGEEAPEPRTLLRRLFNLKAFDPLSFERMKPKEQAATVQDMLGVDLKKFDEERAKIYEERRQIGVEGKQLSGQLAGATFHDDGPEQEQSATELMQELDNRRSQNETRQKLELAAQNYRDESIRLGEAVTADEQEIERLKEKIRKKEAEIKDKQEQIKSCDESLEKTKASLESEEYAPADEQEVRDRIDRVDEENQKVRDNAEHKRLKEAVEESRKKYAAMTKKIEKIDEEKADAIAAAPWPVEGMELHEDGLLLNGLPFEQASRSERILASTYVGMTLNPKLRLMVSQNGGDLDNETLDALDQALNDNDFQMIVELVTRSQQDEDRCAVVISDGSVVGSDEGDMVSSAEGAE